VKVSYKDRIVYALVYRNGHGGVTMAVSTDHGEHVWDFVLKNPGDTVWYDKLCNDLLARSEIIEHCFKPLIRAKRRPNLSASLIALIANSPVEPLTTCQSTGQDWFFLRFLLLTSRPVGRMIKIYSGNELELRNRDSWGIIKRFLNKVSPGNDEPPAPAPAPADQHEDNDENGGTPDTAEGENNITPPEAGGGQQITTGDNNELEQNTPADVVDQHFHTEDLYNDIPRLKTDDAYAGLLYDQVTEEEQNPAYIPLQPAAYIHILNQIGGTPSSASNQERQLGANKKKVIEWLSSHKVLRPYYFASAAILKRLANQLNVDIGSAKTATQIRKKIEAFLLSNWDTEPPLVDVELENPTGETRATTNIANLTKAQKILHISLKSGYLPSLDGKAKGYAQRGLQLEGPLLQQVLKDSEMGLTPIKVLELGSAPLVLWKPNQQPAIKGIGGSVDAVARAVVPRSVDTSESDSESDDPFEEEEEEELILVEAKARVTDRTAAKERVTQGIARLQAANPRLRHTQRKKYWVVNAESDIFSLFVNDANEAIQILHHAAVYDVRFVLLVMGNETADILGGLFVKFSRRLRGAWRKVLEDLFEQGLSWAYGENGPHFDREFLDPVTSTIKIQNKKDGVLDFRSLKQWVLLWHDVRCNKALPLPPIARIIPYALSMWNSFKGGSDTLTKLLWNADYDPPTKEIQGHVVARMLLLATTVLHRLNHIATAKPDLKFYNSLRHYRNAANQRYSFHRFLLALSHVVKGPMMSIPPTVSPAAGRMAVPTRARAAVKETVFGAALTGNTPKYNAHARMHSVLEKDRTSLDRSEIQLVDRWKNCKGPLLYHVNAKGDQGPKRKCFICSKQTSWKCVGCHENFCSISKVPETIETETGKKPPSLLKITFPGNEKEVIFARNTCWLHQHSSALEAAVNGLE
jgi:hypothetical protein